MGRLTDLFPPLPGFGDDVDQWMQRALQTVPQPFVVEQGYPALNGFEQGDQVKVEAELPGVLPADVDVSVAGTELALSGVRKQVRQPQTTWTRQERPDGKFSRTLTGIHPAVTGWASV